MSQARQATPLKELRPSRSGQQVYVRRTGVAFLSLVAATNCVPWMKLVTAGQTVTEEMSGVPAEFGAAIGSCFLGVLVIIVAWLAGRRTWIPSAPPIARPRDVGLVLAIVASALNLALGAAIQWVEAGRLMDVRAEAWTVAALWYLVLLPTQALAGFCKGQASVPIPRRTSPSL